MSRLSAPSMLALVAALGALILAVVAVAMITAGARAALFLS